MNKLRFNDKELSFVAHESTPDREGLLEKKGAVKGQGYRQRWFRLKGNLLFYFKMDEFQDWQSTDPLGVIVLERCKVEDLHSGSNPFGFGLVFNGDDSRNYILKAYSKQDQEGWMEAIEIASYERLKNTLYTLKLKLEDLTGKDPLKDFHVFSGDSEEVNSSSMGLKVAFERAPARGKANIINAPQSQLKNAPCYVLTLEGKNIRYPCPFSTRVHVLYASDSASSHHLVVVDSTEISETTTNGSIIVYWHVILLQLGIHLSHTGILIFRLVLINSQDPVPNGGNNHDGNLEKVTFQETELGTVNCSVSEILACGNKQDQGNLTLSLSKNQRSAGFLNVRVKQVRHNPLPPPPSQLIPTNLGNGSSKSKPKKPSSSIHIQQDFSIRPSDILPDIAREQTWKHFMIPRNNNNQLNVVEELAESVFNTLVPLELLKCLKLEDSIQLDEVVYNIGAVTDHHLKSLKCYQGYLFECVGYYSAEIKQLEATEVDVRGFKPSQERQDPSLQFLPTNMHIQRLHVSSSTDNEMHTYNTVTMGSPADHVTGHKDGVGLITLLNNLPSNPSFISHYSNYNSSSLIKSELDKLSAIRRNLDSFKNNLYRNSANANPQEMAAAFTGISTEIQKLLAMMQSSVVLESIQDLVRARPGNPSPNITSSASISTTSELFIPEDRRKLSMRKKLPAPNRIGCSCGACSKCIPSPSDWLWNGSHYIQVSTGEWKLEDSTACIQELLVLLLDKVEDASKKVVEQQHEAHAASADNKILTFTPSYVWSSSLIPTFCELNQSAEGLLKLARSSLSFKIMSLDSCISGLYNIKRRLDIVFCQAITGLVTSFYLTLNEYFNDTEYLKQLREVGFLAQYECLLSSAVEEKGMLEDMVVAVAELKSVSFKLAAISGSEMDFRITGNRQNLIIHLLFNSKILSNLPDDQLRLGYPINVIPCLIAYGMNETTITDATKKLSFLQEGVNRKGISSLFSYIDNYKQLTLNTTNPITKKENLEIRQMFKQLKEKYDIQKSKNVEFLINVQQLCRKLKGGRITTCRTGKDRSGMSVTLEECCLLRTHHKLEDSSFVKALATLRSTGTQLENCFKNTGHRCYRFSSTQYNMLPRILQPPASSCRHSVLLLDQS